jgi:hypothetical protein
MRIYISRGLHKFKITLASFILSSSVFALEVTHQVRPYSNFESAMLNSACATMKTGSFASRCNPALFPMHKIEGVSLSLMGKADGDSVDNARDLIFKPIDEALIRRLFEEKNFNSFSLSTDLSFQNSFFELSYSPYFLLADLYLFNPAFPEISLNLVNRESLRLTSGYIMFGKRDSEEDLLSLGASVYYYDHQYENTSFSLFDLSSQRPENLIKFKSETGVSGDLGLFYQTELWFLPNFSMQIKNLASKIEINDSFISSATRQETLALFETYSSIGIGESFSTQFGGFEISLELPFTEIYEEMITRLISLGLRYDLRLFNLFMGFSEHYQNIGFQFRSQNFNVGISYGREADLGKSQSTSENSVYVGVDVFL